MSVRDLARATWCAMRNSPTMRVCATPEMRRAFKLVDGTVFETPEQADERIRDAKK